VGTRPSVWTPCACHCHALTEIRGTKPKACLCVLDIGRIDVDARAIAAPRGRPSFEACTLPSLRRLRRLARGAHASDHVIDAAVGYHLGSSAAE